MRKVIKQSIDRQIEQLKNYGFPPAAVLLSREKYTEFLKELAYDRETDSLEAIGDYEGVLVVIAPGEDVVNVVPNAEVHWNNAAEIDEQAMSIVHKREIRFTEI